ncbi:hypothetical protein [Microvirga ossetica]|uniref:hypothetical protein n=1 Tax=Microvirga ossetica TaxID=1882682 RepID=UPI0013000FDC|nr:hypothetical protein [Microvirga ossetica]
MMRGSIVPDECDWLTHLGMLIMRRACGKGRHLHYDTDNRRRDVRRETSNRIRFVIEDLIPPALKDSALFRCLGRMVYGPYIDHMADFRKRAPFLTEKEYEKLYREYPHIHSGTDNSSACLAQATSDIVGTSVCDVGCGNGYLLNYIQTHAVSDFRRLVGMNFDVPSATNIQRVEFVEGKSRKSSL